MNNTSVVPPTVLVVDDDPAELRRLLASHGYVARAEAGENVVFKWGAGTGGTRPSGN